MENDNEGYIIIAKNSKDIIWVEVSTGNQVSYLPIDKTYEKLLESHLRNNEDLIYYQKGFTQADLKLLRKSGIIGSKYLESKEQVKSFISQLNSFERYKQNSGKFGKINSGSLEDRLEEAVKTENFEEAARLRDKLKVMEKNEI